jgi:hypothetical protein
VRYQYSNVDHDKDGHHVDREWDGRVEDHHMFVAVAGIIRIFTRKLYSIPSMPARDFCPMSGEEATIWGKGDKRR